MTEGITKPYTAQGDSNYGRVAEWLERAQKKQNGLTMGVQAGVMVEEMTELFDTMTLASASGTASVLLTEASRLLKEVASQLKTGEAFLYFYDREATLDAFCDIDVTVNGTAYLGGFDKASADAAVIDSLFDKFMPDGTPVILPGGKIGKRPGWVAPDLSSFIGEATNPSEEDQPFHPYMEADRWAKEFHRNHPTIDIEDGVLRPLILKALLVGKELQVIEQTAVAEPIEVPVGVQQTVQQLNDEAAASSNSINPTL